MSDGPGIDVEHLDDGTVRIVMRSNGRVAKMRVSADYAKRLAARLVVGAPAPAVTYEGGVPSDLIDRLAEKIAERAKKR